MINAAHQSICIRQVLFCIKKERCLLRSFMSFSRVHLSVLQLFDESELFLPLELPLKRFVRKKTDKCDEPDEGDRCVEPESDTVGKRVVLLRPTGEKESDDEPVQGRNTERGKAYVLHAHAEQPTDQSRYEYVLHLYHHPFSLIIHRALGGVEDVDEKGDKSLNEKINQEILEYEETIFWGLTLRQFLFSAIAVIVAVTIYFGLKRFIGTETVSWVCVLAAFPFAALGFIKYHGLHAEQFAAIVIRQLATPKRLDFEPVDPEEYLWDPDDEDTEEANVFDQNIEDSGGR